MTSHKGKNGILAATSRIKTVREVDNSNNSNPKVNLRVDIRNIMTAFGDSSEPCEESVTMMEKILQLELNGFLYLCGEAAELTQTGTKTLGLQEAIYTMKNDKNRLLRLFKYFATKDQQLKILKQNQVSNKPIRSSYMTEIVNILEGFDDTGEMLQLLTIRSVTESKKTEQALKADRLHLRSSLPHYIAYAKARSVSFARKLVVLQEWMKVNLRSEYRQSPVFMEVMAFLTYELVAHIVDLTFIVRRERCGHGNPILRLCDPRGFNPETCASAFQLQKKRKDDECNSVSEILVQASEMEAKRLKKMPGTRNALSLLPSEISEAYRRYQAHCPTTLPSQSYKSRADRRNKLTGLY